MSAIAVFCGGLDVLECGDMSGFKLDTTCCRDHMHNVKENI